MPAYRALSYHASGQSIFIATSAYESVKAGYALSLAKTVAELERRHIPYGINLIFGACHVDDARNDLVRDFLDNTSCSDLVFIDADMMWEPEMFLRLIQHNVEGIIAGAYPFKSNRGDFPVGKILGGIESGHGRKALLSVSYAPTGFMRIPRVVFEKLTAPGAGKLNPSRRFFERRYTDKTYDGGDVTFCRKWIAAGGEVLVDPTLTLTHIGENRWTGNFQSYLSKPANAVLHTMDSKDPVPDYKPDSLPLGDAVAAILAGKTEPDDFKALADAYGNKPWALSAEGLHTIWRMATNLKAGQTILECGSGISTVVLAIAAAKVGARLVAFEENGPWAEKVCAILTEHELDADVQVRRIKDGWYDTQGLDGISADLLIVDGPTRASNGGQRIGPPFKIPGLASSAAAVFFDDVHLRQVTAVGLVGGFADVEAGPKPMVVGRLGEEARKAMA